MHCRVLILITIGFTAATSAHYKDESKSGYTLILPENNRQQPMVLSFAEAQRWCSANASGSKLISINNKVSHNSIASFLDNATKEGRLNDNNAELIRLNGRYHLSNTWSWINGNEAKGFNVNVTSEPSSSIFLNGVIKATDFHIHSRQSNISRYCICEYPDKRTECQLYLNSRCYVTETKYSPTWYQARNDCLNKGGDLASFETLSDQMLKESLKNLSLYSTWTSTYEYWIGIQKGAWIWEDSSSSIQMTNWAKNSSLNSAAQCLCLHRLSHWKWMECNCNDSHPFICIDQLKASEETFADKKTELFVGVIVFCLIIVVSISVALFFLVKRRKRRINRDFARQTNQTSEAALTSSADIESQTSKFTKSKAKCGNSAYYIQRISENSPTGQPDESVVYSVVQKPVYASVQTPSTPGNYPKQRENYIPSSNVVYADFDILPSAR